MAVGFQSFSSDGGLQFDTEVEQLGLISKGVVNYTTGTLPGSGGQYYVHQLSFPAGKTPMLAIHSTKHHAVIWHANTISLNPTNVSYEIRIVAPNNSPQQGSFEWYLFDSVAITTSGNFGLQTFTETGARSFDSSKYPLRVRAVDEITPDQYEYVKYGTQIPAGKKYAFVTERNAMHAEPDGGAGDAYAVCYIKTTSGQRMEYQEVWDWNWLFPIAMIHPGKFLIVDVTNF